MLLSGWGLLVVAVLISVVGVVGVRAVQHQVAGRAARSAELSARLVASLTVRPNLALDAKGVPFLSPSVRADMDTDVVGLKQQHEISGLELWVDPTGGCCTRIRTTGG